MPSNSKNSLCGLAGDPKPIGLFFRTTAEYFELKVCPAAFEEALERIQGPGQGMLCQVGGLGSLARGQEAR